MISSKSVEYKEGRISSLVLTVDITNPAFILNGLRSESFTSSEWSYMTENKPSIADDFDYIAFYVFGSPEETYDCDPVNIDAEVENDN
jgi:hypothetical protein